MMCGPKTQVSVLANALAKMSVVYLCVSYNHAVHLEYSGEVNEGK